MKKLICALFIWYAFISQVYAFDCIPNQFSIYKAALTNIDIIEVTSVDNNNDYSNDSIFQNLDGASIWYTYVDSILNSDKKDRIWENYTKESNNSNIMYNVTLISQEWVYYIFNNNFNYIECNSYWPSISNIVNDATIQKILLVRIIVIVLFMITILWIFVIIFRKRYK